MSRRKVVVFAYHNVGVRCLKVLLHYWREVKVSLVVTHRDNPKENIWFDNVEMVAKQAGAGAGAAVQNAIPVICPEDPNEQAVISQIKEINPDYIFSFYYRHMLCAEILQLARLGAFNMHGSLLPKYRGRVPVNWAIINGEVETGATLHVMNERPDNGPIVDQQAVPILDDDSVGEVFNKVTVAAEMVLFRSLPRLLSGEAVFTVQNLRLGKYFGGRKAEDGKIDWQRSPAQEMHNMVRAVTHPFPGAFFFINGKKITVWRTRIVGAPATGIATGIQVPAPVQVPVRIYHQQDQVYVNCIDKKQLLLLDFEVEGKRYQQISLPDFENIFKM
ncbi:MAG: formyltransferase [Oligoflexia bacterium]|nr:formyltransferase [Oligoflexia bacterium]